MPRKFALATIALLAAVAAIGCTDNTTVLQPSQEAPGIAVSGRGEVTAPPDTGYFNVGVEFRAKTVADAREGAAKAAEAVINSVKKNGVDAKDIQTTQFRIDPQWETPRGSTEPRITGYTVNNTVEVKVRKLDSFSKVIDDAVDAGGDATRLQGIRFDIEDNEKMLEQARKAAMEDARKKAAELAALGGVKLGTPLSIAEDLFTAPPPQVFRGAEDKAAAGIVPTPIETGTGNVVVTVSVRWSIEK